MFFLFLASWLLNHEVIYQHLRSILTVHEAHRILFASFANLASITVYLFWICYFAHKEQHCFLKIIIFIILIFNLLYADFYWSSICLSFFFNSYNNLSISFCFKSTFFCSSWNFPFKSLTFSEFNSFSFLNWMFSSFNWDIYYSYCSFIAFILPNSALSPNAELLIESKFLLNFSNLIFKSSCSICNLSYDSCLSSFSF